VKLVPDDPIILEHLGDVYLKLDQPDRALHFYKEALLIKKENKEQLEGKIQSLTLKGL
jgi:predicted negative regulator of RcsB-dependent stress response